MAKFIYSIGGVAIMAYKPAKQVIAGSTTNANYAFIEFGDDTPIRVLKQGDLFLKND